MLRYNVSSSTGTFNTVASGSAVNGNAIHLGQSFQKVKALSALLTVLAETNTFTIAARWQVSNDNSTFVNVANGPQNAAGVVLATGTAGADTAVTIAVPAPEAIYGWKYARMTLVAGGTTGASADTYAIGYSYHQNSVGEVSR